MSYLVTGTNDYLSGTLASGPGVNGGYDLPITIGMYIAYTNHPSAYQCAMQLGNTAASASDKLAVTLSSPDGSFAAQATDSGGSSNNATYTLADAAVYDSADLTNAAVWIPVLCVWTSSTSRTIYVGTTAQTQSNSTSRTVSGDLRLIRIGELLTGGSEAQIKVAEIAIWNSALASGDRTSFMGGTSADQIDAANLLAYWSCASNATQTGGSDAVGSLSVTSATYSADHPIISGSTTTYLKLLAHPSAASAADIEGVVLNETRDTVIGEFSGQAFGADLVGGEAQLLVAVTNITPNGSTLTTSNTPIVFAYNATDSIIGPGSATVVEL